MFAENLTRDIYRDLGLPKPEHATFVDLLGNSSFAAITPKVVLDKLHALRIHGNKAAHGEPATVRTALWLIQEAFDLGRWLFVQFAKGDAAAIPAFVQPLAEAVDESKGQLKREKRQVLEKLAAQEAQMVALLRELDPAMQKVYQSFDVGFFDLIIADESHRSIYNVYGDMFHYFDCLQIGLTATPIDFVSRNTFSLFGCEGQLPTANYDLEQAVQDGFLTPFEVFEHTTQFLREGIRLDILTKEQIQELEEQGEDPAQYDFSSEQIDKIIYNKDTNRAILRNLMENGLRDATGQLPGKSIIFARNHQHAVLMRQMFDEMYPQYGGRFCQVIDNYDPRAEQLIDDFKGDGANSELTIAISVDMLDTGIDIPEILNLVLELRGLPDRRGVRNPADPLPCR